MARFAIVDPTGDAPRIERYLELPDGTLVLPVLETQDEPGDNQVLGSAEVTIAEGFVRAHTAAVRALSGVVAELNDAGEIVRTLDLGKDLVQVTSDIVPYVEVKPEFDPGTQVLEGPTTTRDSSGVRREWKVRNKTRKELAAEDDERKEEAIAARFGDLGLQMAFDQENRVRLLEGKDRLPSIEAFKAELKAAL